ncbi:hypothetical protein B0P06_004281 [Clostridium saccharoperbutylacetonicum]|uniref:hypothetical protein n=1 Tax=Clostridium saccharoperbutylacetonicum TaxID=36745 RepID=UPI000346B8BB|nr:hypothetical protein [Clostridium saccharoperbutylacetonicum]NRT61814.1 hypothetical protein [Clostridium saccharoperbutylacetonicum]NSB25140.1 hypothetical protein [Clostridium saccharoperbutylacetonicum]NSB44510.1 hypothetical protein [Clostridium saccharoperbutylacetonicum]
MKKLLKEIEESEKTAGIKSDGLFAIMFLNFKEVHNNRFGRYYKGRECRFSKNIIHVWR